MRGPLEMTCYTRHLSWLFDALGLAETPENSRRLDEALRGVLGLPETATCPEVWAEVKQIDGDGWAELEPDLLAALAES